MSLSILGSRGLEKSGSQYRSSFASAGRKVYFYCFLNMSVYNCGYYGRLNYAMSLNFIDT